MALANPLPGVQGSRYLLGVDLQVDIDSGISVNLQDDVRLDGSHEAILLYLQPVRPDGKVWQQVDAGSFALRIAC